MKIIESAISDLEIDQIRRYAVENRDKKYTNWEQDQDIIDQRTTIDEQSPEFKIIRRIVSRNFSSVVKIWSAYQIQTNPHNIHIDDYEKSSTSRRYTYVLAFDTIPEFHTIVWKQRCVDNDALHRFVADWGANSDRKKVTDISATEDLEHTWDPNQEDYMADYLDIDGIFEYRKGWACLFRADQLHCTSNWKKYPQFNHRELLQIHVLSDQEGFD